MGNENKKSTAERLKQIMGIYGYRQIDMLKAIQPYCEKWGVKIGSNGLSQYITGKVEPRQRVLSIFSEAFNVSPVWLMGYDVPMEENTEAITPRQFMNEVLELMDKTNLPEQEKKILEMQLKYICDNSKNGE